MKRLIPILILLFSFIGCSTYKPVNIDNEYTFGAKMMNAYEGYYSAYQFDSICKVDDINSNLNDWQKLSIQDYENGVDASQYFYIKSLGKNEIIYRVFMVNDSVYKITKRITR